MKTLKFIPALLLFFLVSCSSVRVNSDYDKKVDFKQYQTFAFYKTGIDKTEISDLDKKRILRSIEESMLAKGLILSENPDLLINIFTKEREQVDVNQFNIGWGYGWGWGWDPWMMGGNTSVYSYPVGTLFIDIIDARKKELIWQGEGEGPLTKDTNKKDEVIKTFVTKILEQYPPVKK